jgi:hypothetical protein
MGGLLDDGAGGPDELRAIVARAGRRMWWRSAAVAGAVAIVAGGGVGYAVSGTGGSARQVVATAPASQGSATNAPSASGTRAAGGSSIAVPEASTFTHLFTRQAGGVEIRGFLVSSPLMLPVGAASTCGSFGSSFQAEVSTSGMVATQTNGFAVSPATGPILSAQGTIAGVREGDPVALVVVETEQQVAKVRMDFTGGATDEMAPVKGWSVLAAAATWFEAGKLEQATIGTLTTFDSSGHTLATMTVQWPPAPMPASGTSGSGVSSGSGTASSGTVSSGTVRATTGESSPAAATPCKVFPPPTPVPCPPPSSPSGAAYACPAVPAQVPGAPTSTATTATRSGG